MAEPDANIPQVVDPERVVDLTRLLQIRGPLGVLNVLDTIIPVVNMGDVVPSDVRVLQPSFRSTDIFSNGVLVAAGGNAILADTGALAEGIYDVHFLAALNTTIAAANIFLTIRNAANTADLAIWPHLSGISGAAGGVPNWVYEFAIELAANERLRAFNELALAAGQTAAATIFARRRT